MKSTIRKRIAKLLNRQVKLVDQSNQVVSRDVMSETTAYQEWITRAADCGLRLKEYNIEPHPKLTYALVLSIVES